MGERWPRLMTAEQVCQRFGVPSPRTLRTMRQQGLAAVRLGKSYLFDANDVEAFIDSKKVQSCPAQTPDLSSHGIKNAAFTTSVGMSAARKRSSQLARQTSAKLKMLSRGSSTDNAAKVAPDSRTK